MLHDSDDRVVLDNIECFSKVKLKFPAWIDGISEETNKLFDQYNP